MTPALGLSRGAVGHTGPWFSGSNGDSTPGHWGESGFIGLVCNSTLVVRVSPALGLFVSNSSCVHGESASDPISSLLLESGGVWTGS